MLFINFLAAMLPIIWLIIALSGLKMAGHKACLIALAIASALALAVWKLSPVNIATAALEGVLNALWPICLVIIAALFTYNMMVKTGSMDQINRMLSSVSTDQRVLVLLIGWGFGNFMEGMAGFGTAVAIPASMLAAMGINPISAAVACLVANSTPTAFGSVGVPTTTLSAVSGIDVLSLCSDVVRMEWLLTFISPFLMICIVGGGLKALRGVLPITFISAVSFILPWYISAGILGSELPDTIGAIVSMACIIAASRFLPAKHGEAYQVCASGSPSSAVCEAESKPQITLKSALVAWSPFILIFILLVLTSKLCMPVYEALSVLKLSAVFYAGEGAATLSFSLNTAGVIIFIAAFIGGTIQGVSPADMVQILAETLKKYWKTIVTICSVMATAKIMGYSGMISNIASLLVAVAGSFYPAIAPLIGALGGFVTGSGTSTSVLFGSLQTQTAASLGLNQSWITAANVVGAGIGKMVCPQSIAIGAGAIDAIGSESKILGAVFKYFILYVALAGLLCWIQAL